MDVAVVAVFTYITVNICFNKSIYDFMDHPPSCKVAGYFADTASAAAVVRAVFSFKSKKSVFSIFIFRFE